MNDNCLFIAFLLSIGALLNSMRWLGSLVKIMRIGSFNLNRLIIRLSPNRPNIVKNISQSGN